MLNELDKELEARKLHFVRYADDSVIAVKSSAAANRVMHTITKWISYPKRQTPTNTNENCLLETMEEVW